MTATTDGGQSYYAIKDLGNPAAGYYTQTTPRNPWDMTIHQGKLYIGAGDYDANSGNTPIYVMDLTTKAWNNSGVVLDEAVTHFVNIEGTLYVPGTDPTTASWAYGNYYHQADGVWQLHSNLPEAVHNFDIVRYGKAFFFGIGTANATQSPVKISEDEGRTYQDVAFYREGRRLIGDQTYDFMRVYNFFLLRGELYCLLVATKQDGTKETAFYRYTEDGFIYMNDTGMTRKHLWQVYVGEAVTLKDQCYIAMGNLYQTGDFQTGEEIIFPNQDYVTDLVAGEDYLYVLTAKKLQDETYINTIWRYVPETGKQIKLTSFQTEGGLGLSLEKSRTAFYVGIGHGTDAGRILEIAPRNSFTRLFGLLPPDKSDPILPEEWS